jgi:hypothetical protein
MNNLLSYCGLTDAGMNASEKDLPVLEEGDFIKVFFYNKSSNFTNPSLPQIEMIDIGHKSLPIIIGP